MWTTMALVTALSVTPAQADLSLSHVRSTYGLLGPERRDDTITPGDTLWLCFNITGIRVDAEGKVRYNMSMEVTDATGRSVFKQEPRDLEVRASLGGNQVAAFARLDIGLDTPPGDYQEKVMVKDRASGKEQSLTRNFKILPRTFALVRVTPALDAEQQYPTGLFLAGGGAWIHASVVGFERDPGTKQPNVVFELRMLDENGTPTLANAMTSTVNKDIPEKLTGVPMAFSLTFNRPGKFTVELLAADQVSGKKARASFPITVLSPTK
jgi:hypothetical protein